MELGIVIGSVWSTRKEERLVGAKLTLVKPLNVLDENADQMPLVAVDPIGAGIGETVIIVKGSTARATLMPNAPVDAGIVGIVDDKEVDSRYKK